MFQCPVCGELLEALTNLHCVSRHQTSKTSFLSTYGTPKYVTPTMNRDVQRWIRDAQVIRAGDFEVAQGAARNQFRKS
jgi:hypothetical protein